MPEAGQQEDLNVFHNEAEGWKRIPKALEETEHNANKLAHFQTNILLQAQARNKKTPCIFPLRQQSYDPLSTDTMK